MALAGPIIRKLGPYLLRGAEAAAYWAISETSGIFDQKITTAAVPFVKAQLEYVQTDTSGLREESLVNTFAVLNVTGDAPDATWTSGDYATVNNALATFLEAVGVYQPGTLIAQRVKYYRWSSSDGPEVDHPVQYIGTQTAQGDMTNTTRLPRQVACSVTLKTASRKHWGRIYLPGPGDTHVDADGRYSNTFVDAVANAFAAMQTTLAASDMAIGVHSRVGRAFLGVTQVQVDDVPDVIRRRRAHTTRYRKQISA